MSRALEKRCSRVAGVVTKIVAVGSAMQNDCGNNGMFDEDGEGEGDDDDDNDDDEVCPKRI